MSIIKRAYQKLLRKRERKVYDNTYTCCEPLDIDEALSPQSEFAHHGCLAHIPHHTGGTGINGGQSEGVG